MKTIVILIIFISSLSATDPTVIKGKLKEVLSKKAMPLIDQKKTPPDRKEKTETNKNLQEDVDRLIFKAFYTNKSMRRLMIELDKQVYLLEINNQIVLNGEKYIVINLNEKLAQLMHLPTKETLTFTYRP